MSQTTTFEEIIKSMEPIEGERNTAHRARRRAVLLKTFVKYKGRPMDALRAETISGFTFEKLIRFELITLNMPKPEPTEAELEAERIEAEKAEAERAERVEAEKAEAEKAEAERIEAEKAEAERVEEITGDGSGEALPPVEPDEREFDPDAVPEPGEVMHEPPTDSSLRPVDEVDQPTTHKNRKRK